VRRAIAESLTALAARDPRILLLTGDLGYQVLDPFVERFPKRFFNVGVAEQNMVGIATGLAEAGYLPFVYSIATFASMRAYEFIRNGPILHRFPVRILGVGGGFEYGPAGASHHGLEDIALMRTQPGLTLVAPADHRQARAALLATWNAPGPVYYRLGKDERSTVPGLDGRFELAGAELVRDGSDLLMVTTGSISTEVVAAAEALASEGVSCAVLVVACLAPAPLAQLAEVLSRFPLALSVEEHYVTGGLGSLVSEVIAESGLSCRLVRCGVRETPPARTGRQEYLRQRHGLTSEGLVETARLLMAAAR
jgi:transketolase